MEMALKMTMTIQQTIAAAAVAVTVAETAERIQVGLVGK